MTTHDLDTGYVPHAWQRFCHEDRKRFNVIIAHRRAGLTEFGLRELLTAADSATLPGSLFGYVVPERAQARFNAWDRLKVMVAQTAVEIDDVNMTVTFQRNGAKIRMLGARDNGLLGIFFDGVVVDNAAFIPSQTWDAVLRPALEGADSRKGWAIVLGSKKPDNKNLLASLFLAHRLDPEWMCRLFGVAETGVLTGAEVAHLHYVLPSRVFASEMECEFEL